MASSTTMPRMRPVVSEASRPRSEKSGPAPSPSGEDEQPARRSPQRDKATIPRITGPPDGGLLGVCGRDGIGSSQRYGYGPFGSDPSQRSTFHSRPPAACPSLL